MTKKLIVNGDGARWIKKLANKLNAYYSLDLFHIIHSFIYLII
ncbi:hypothetical protein [Metamycoplasma auris]|nr:hypothetical protein [Metamycoplasma auris]